MMNTQLNNKSNHAQYAATIVTSRGIALSLTKPARWMIDDRDIARALSRIPRFNGHTLRFYSVAQHCVLASLIVPPQDALAALLHDAPEAYIGDMVSPLKAIIPSYKAIEHSLWCAIADRFDLDIAMPASIKAADLQLLATEKRDLLTKSTYEWPQLRGVEPMCETIEPWSADLAEAIYKVRLEELMEVRS